MAGIRKFQYPRVGSWLVNLHAHGLSVEVLTKFQYPRVGSWLVNHGMLYNFSAS